MPDTFPGAATHCSAPAAPAAARLLVIILNFNGLADTLACLESLGRQTCRGFAVLVIDNASRADEAAAIAASFPAVEVLRLPANRGWASGNNVGLEHAAARGSDFACLLNNDTVLAPEALDEMLAAAGRIGAPALLHPAIHCFDDPARPQLDPALPPQAKAAARRLAEEYDIVEIGWAYGACLMVPMALVRQVGLLDERFFLQLEEEDFYRRARARGVRSYCARRARILHKDSPSFGGPLSPDKLYYEARNRLLLAEKHATSLRTWLAALRDLLWSLHARAQASGRCGWSGLLRWLLSADPLARAARQGVADYLRRRFGGRHA